jgi:uncharacterized membrane protein
MKAEKPARSAAGINRAELDDFHRLFAPKHSIGDRVADKVAAVGGSWAFIIGFSVFMAAWAVVNSIVLANHAFDPFPFIFLNLMLSMVAALQAPLIMMSQNRQAKKDRLEARIDYETNAHAAGEIALVQDKLDVLISILISDKDVRASVLDLIQRSKVN